MDGLKISSNWNSKSENSLKNLVTYHQADNKCDLECIAPETCICLTKSENDSSYSKPELDVQLKHLIKEINIFSEGSLIEVFGAYNEYLFTCVSEFIDDWAGMAVYHAKIVLPGINTCKLKFTRIREEGRLWLYSVQLLVIRTEEPSNHSLFNFENVNNLINNSGQQLSEKAEKFKKFFEYYASNFSNSQPSPSGVQSFFNLINRECNIQLSDCKTFTTLLSTCESLSSSKKTDQITNELSLEYQYMKCYIDKKLIEMKEDLLKFIENKLNKFRDENNARLDYIVKLLEGSKI